MASTTILRIMVVMMIAITIIPQSGCSRHRIVSNIDALSDVQRGAVPEPVGVKLCQWQNAQVQQAAKDQTVLYKADFIGQSAELAPAATDKIVQSLRNGTANLQTWMIEPTGDSYQDSIRVNSVTQRLAYWGVINPQVAIGIPTALGMPGVIAETNFRNSNVNTRNRSTSRNQIGF